MRFPRDPLGPAESGDWGGAVLGVVDVCTLVPDGGFLLK